MALMKQWFPMALHLLEGIFYGSQRSQRAVGERERLLALGSLSAGLTHELNNPAAAAVRATSSLRERVAGMRHKLAIIAGGAWDPQQLQTLIGLQERVAEQVAKAPELSPIEASDREDELGDWFDAHGIGRHGFAALHGAPVVPVLPVQTVPLVVPPQRRANELRALFLQYEQNTFTWSVRSAAIFVTVPVLRTKAIGSAPRPDAGGGGQSWLVG